MTTMQSCIVALLCAAAALPSAVNGQLIKSDGVKPQFEVATVRPNTSGESGASIRVQRGGRFTATNQTLRNLIRNVFNVQPFQLIGGPDWIDSDRFDVVAKVADADLNGNGMLRQDQIMLRVQALLEERFRMTARLETRELPVYALVVVSEGKLGPNLKAIQVIAGASRVRRPLRHLLRPSVVCTRT